MLSINTKRVRALNDHQYHGGPVLYWMNRDQRAQDNWALLYAQELALGHGVPLAVVFNLVPDFLGGGLRQLHFKLEGLKEVEENLAAKNIPFFLVTGQETEAEIVSLVKKQNIGALVTDFFPLRICRAWIEYLRKNLTIPFSQVDAHNIVPCWIASPKQEFAARTIRPKIHALLPEFLEEFPTLKKHPYPWEASFPRPPDWNSLLQKTNTDRSVLPVDWIKPGAKAAQKALRQFLDLRLEKYSEQRNDPTKGALSSLSPYFHYGHLAPQRAALEAQRHDKSISSQESFLEELIVRRELADNYCHYNADYDNPKGFPAWAQKTLQEHALDPRDHRYSQKEFEDAKTHDELWNAAQLEMVKTGKMHGYMRMYWAKKILEWTKSATGAQKIAIYLNDKYELDGRDPNGYTGIAWSIGGLHDRPWFPRPVFGTVRYMSESGCRKKFSVNEYININKP